MWYKESNVSGSSIIMKITELLRFHSISIYIHRSPQTNIKELQVLFLSPVLKLFYLKIISYNSFSSWSFPSSTPPKFYPTPYSPNFVLSFKTKQNETIKQPKKEKSIQTSKRPMRQKKKGKKSNKSSRKMDSYCVANDYWTRARANSTPLEKRYLPFASGYQLQIVFW